jgi:hypothetical protein
MSNRLMIVLAAISLVGSSVASGALAAPHHVAGKARHLSVAKYQGAGKVRHLSGAYASEEAIGAEFAPVGEVDQWSQGFRDDASAPRYHGGPKSPY